MEYSELIRERRSVRDFQPGKTVAPELIRELVSAAQLAPSWKNSQTGRYYAVCDPALLADVRETCLPGFNQRNCQNASALLVTTFVRGVSGFSAGQPENELGDGWGAYDLGLQAAYLILKARELGLDSLIMGIRDGDALRDKLGIPENEQITAVLALGWRAGQPGFPRRKELGDVLKLF